MPSSIRKPKKPIKKLIKKPSPLSELTRERKERRKLEKELVEARGAAQTAEQAKRNFLSAISHEIRTPLSAILGMAELLSESELNPNQRRYVEVFQRAGDDLLALINDLLDLSTMKSGHLRLERLNFDLAEVVAQVTDLFAPRAKAKGIVLRSRLAHNLPKSLMGDPSRLRQVFMNLLGNAVKFTENGEIVLSVENSSSNVAGEIRFAISDTGIGIPQEALGEIFKDFTQADGTLTKQYGGVGVGLSICRRLVEALGGTLEVTSEIGKGSTFCFSAKFGVAEAAPLPPPPATDDYGLPLRILIADDSPQIRLLLEMFLRPTPHKITFVVNGQLAVETFRTESFDLILMDVQMPVLDGLSATRAIRAIEKEEGRVPVPIVALTANARKEDYLFSTEAGCTAHLPKPFSRGSLVSTLKEYAPAPRPAPVKIDPIEAAILKEIQAAIPGYLASKRSDANNLPELLRNGDFKGIQTIAHNLKGTGTTYGFPKLSSLGAAMEDAAKAADHSAIESHAAELNCYLATLPTDVA